MKRTTSILAIAILTVLPAGMMNAQSSSTAPKASAAAEKAAASPAVAASPAAATKTTTTTATASATAPAGAAAARSDVYRVHFTHAVPGKAAQLADALKQPDPTAPMPGHSIMLRHQEGDSWDYVQIEHLGSKASIEAVRPAQPNPMRDLSDWHTDTYVNGPAWAEFAKAMGINEGAGKSAVYIVSVYRNAPGHRDQLDTLLTTSMPGDPAAGNVVLQHLDGAAWTFLAVARFATWEDFVKSETDGANDKSATSTQWAQLREHTSYHTDTLADRIQP